MSESAISLLVCMQHSSFACTLTLSSAVCFLHQLCRSLTAVSCSSLWLMARHEVYNIEQAWCDFKASAKTPALTIYNTLEASQSPTLPSYSVGSTSFTHVPLSFSDPLGSAIQVTKLLLCNRLSDSIDPLWNILWTVIQYTMLLTMCVIKSDYAQVQITLSYLGTTVLSSCNGTGRWSHISLPALWLNTKPVPAVIVIAQKRAVFLDENWRCLSALPVLSLPFANSIKTEALNSFLSLYLLDCVWGTVRVCVCVQAHRRSTNYSQQMEQPGSVSLMTSLYLK